MLIETTKLHIPRATPELADAEFDITSLAIAEGRIPEISHVTPTKAPELLAMFNVAFLDAARMVTFLEAEYLQSKRNADKIRSVVILDRAPAILEAKGLTTGKNRAGSEDLRKAVLDGDEEYQAALERSAKIECFLELMKTKSKGIEMAYSSVKKVLGENAFNYGNPNIKGGNEGEGGIGVQQGYGRSNYSSSRG